MKMKKHHNPSIPLVNLQLGEVFVCGIGTIFNGKLYIFRCEVEG